MNDRRSTQRCPICQGPVLTDANRPDGTRCRNSTCLYNHTEQICPRCESQDLEGVTYEKNQYKYVCRECTHKWSAPA